MSFSLGISSLIAVEMIEDIHGNVVYIYTQQEHQNVGVGLEELRQWRTMWPQFEFNYNSVVDAHDMWKKTYDEKAEQNYDLRFQRNLMLGVTGFTISGLITALLIGLVGN